MTPALGTPEVMLKPDYTDCRLYYTPLHVDPHLVPEDLHWDWLGIGLIDCPPIQHENQ